MRYAKAIGKEFETTYPEVVIDWTILMAGAVCHDIGKPFEFDPANRKRWNDAPADSGFPTFRHSVFGMHVCITVGLPDEVAHIAVGHSFEGLYMGVSAPSDARHSNGRRRKFPRAVVLLHGAWRFPPRRLREYLDLLGQGYS